MKIDKLFQLKIVIFTALKNRCILHGRVFVMNMIICDIFFIYPQNIHVYFYTTVCLHYEGGVAVLRGLHRPC